MNIDRGQRHIWVNLTDFTAKIVDHGRVTFTTRSVIGALSADRQTPEFSDEMEYMAINPTWNIPRSITTKEYLPMMKRNRNAAGHLKIVDSRGRIVPRSAINFAAYTERTFPYSMKQPPSDANALGLVKFMFPNPYNIYLHDTPSKSLFAREVRAFSHGCIRLSDPFDFAYALLAAQTDDPEGLFKSHLNTGQETNVRLEVPLPVHLVYFTAYPSDKGRIEYRRDIYGRDATIFRALTDAGVELAADRG
jgi:murein L,D-transpeptidase YcbB/YkuD